MAAQSLALCAQRPQIAHSFRAAIWLALVVTFVSVFYPRTVWAAPAEEAQPSCDIPQTLTAVADTWLEQQTPSANYGSDPLLLVKTHGSIKWRTLVRFAQPSIPAGCMIESASLYLVAATWSEGRTLEAAQLADDWSEELVSWGGQPTITGTVATAVAGSIVVWDVTPQIEGMLAAGTDYGFRISDAVEGNAGEEKPGAAQEFYSREQTENQPLLIITFAGTPDNTSPDATTPDTAAPDTTAPETTLISGPDATTTSTEATFTFSASEPDATFLCALDGAAFALCTVPAVYTGLGVGVHTFAVQAIDAAGNVDETPATYTWTVEPPAEVPAPEVQQPDVPQTGDDPADAGTPQTGNTPANPNGDQTGDNPANPDGNQSGDDPAGPDGGQTGDNPANPDGSQSDDTPADPDGGQNGDDPAAPDASPDGDNPADTIPNVDPKPASPHILYLPQTNA